MLMSLLGSKTRSIVLFKDLTLATNLWTRMKGLLGTQSLTAEQAMWIHRCQSIHTFFMKFAIDCVFVDQNLTVVDVVEQVVPSRIVFPRYKASSVIEMKAGEARAKGIYKGEQLYVDC